MYQHIIVQIKFNIEKYLRVASSAENPCKVTLLFDRNFAFFTGSILAVLVVLTVIDEDVLSVEHVLTTMTIAGRVDNYYSSQLYCSTKDQIL